MGILKGETMIDSRQEWFKNAKYGLFIHWGLYAILGGEYEGKQTNNIAEWIMLDFKIPATKYRELASQFNPQHFDAREIVRKAKSWGMKYIVFTTKHHEGFAMWESKCNSYNVVEASPYGKDVLRELQLACEEYDMKLGLYYSQAQDWDDPNGYSYGVDNSNKDFRKYLEEKCKPQIREILTEYGEIGLIWFDTPVDMTKEESKELYDYVKSIQPNCVVSGRIGHGMGEYLTTGDNFIPSNYIEADFEVPATLNDTWGYSKSDEHWKKSDDIIELLAKINSRGGNYLLNVGPTPDGVIPEGSLAVLDEVGKYVSENEDGIIGTKYFGDYCYDIQGIYFTRKAHKIFLHILKPKSRLEILNIGNKVKKAYILKDNETLEFMQKTTCEGDSYIEIYIPEVKKSEKNYCICLETEEENPIFEVIQDL